MIDAMAMSRFVWPRTGFGGPMSMLGRWGMVLVVAACAATGAMAEDLTNAQREAAITFTLNNTRHTLLHEIGHLFVDQFDLPVLGKEEDAVDTFATLTMLNEGTPASLQ